MQRTYKLTANAKKSVISALTAIIMRTWYITAFVNIFNFYFFQHTIVIIDAALGEHRQTRVLNSPEIVFNEIKKKKKPGFDRIDWFWRIRNVIKSGRACQSL